MFGEKFFDMAQMADVGKRLIDHIDETKLALDELSLAQDRLEHKINEVLTLLEERENV